MFRAQHELRSMAWEDWEKEHRIKTLIPTLAGLGICGYNATKFNYLTTGGKVFVVAGLGFFTYYTLGTISMFQSFGKVTPGVQDTQADNSQETQ